MNAGIANNAVTFILPVEVVSETNRRDHWAARHRRAKRQKQIAFVLTRSHAGSIRDRLANDNRMKLVVILTRIMRRRQRPFDTDNLAAGFKAVRDGVARALGIDDGSARVKWRCEQGRDHCGGTVVRIEIAENDFEEAER